MPMTGVCYNSLLWMCTLKPNWINWIELRIEMSFHSYAYEWIKRHPFLSNWIKDTKLKHAFIEKIINVPIQNKLL